MAYGQRLRYHPTPEIYRCDTTILAVSGNQHDRESIYSRFPSLALYGVRECSTKSAGKSSVHHQRCFAQVEKISLGRVALVPKREGQLRMLQTGAKPPATVRPQHRRDIDGLRAIAVLSVLGFHIETPGFSGGFIGVDVFFVISGFLICGIIVGEIEQDRFSIARFYERRCKRILPALFTVLIFCLVAAIFVLSPYESQQLGRSVIATTLSVSNVEFWRVGNYFDHGGILNPLLMTWSLAVEEQFYIIFPWLMLLLYKRSRSHLLGILSVGCAASLGLCVYLEFHHPSPNFYLPVLPRLGDRCRHPARDLACS